MRPQKPVGPLDPHDWNFDAVPDGELVACCYWEYARESAFIRDVRRRCLDPKWKQMLNSELWEYCGNDIERIQSIGYAAEVFLKGLFFDKSDDGKPRHPEAPPTTGSFPNPWQALTPEERRYRAHIGSDVERIPLVPFKRGTSLDAGDIREFVKGRQKAAEFERENVKRQNPTLTEEALLRLGKLKHQDILPSLYWEGGGEVTVVSISWGSFTNDEIVNYFRKWVKVNRPKQYPKPSRKGHKPGDWRANLTRLAVMRLLARFTPLRLIDPGQDLLPALWETKQFSRPKWRDVTKWHDARREAGALFRKLFTFLPSEERPLSWRRMPAAK